MAHVTWALSTNERFASLSVGKGKKKKKKRKEKTFSRTVLVAGRKLEKLGLRGGSRLRSSRIERLFSFSATDRRPVTSFSSWETGLQSRDFLGARRRGRMPGVSPDTRDCPS